jgi:hypothetical protein
VSIHDKPDLPLGRNVALARAATALHPRIYKYPSPRLPFLPPTPLALQGKLSNFEKAVKHAQSGQVPAHQLLDRAAVQVRGGRRAGEG